VSGAPLLLLDAGNSRIKWALVAANTASVSASTVSVGDAEDAANAAAGRGTLRAGAFEHDGAPDWRGLPRPAGAWISNVAGKAAGGRIDGLIDAAWAGLPRATIQASARQCGVSNGYTEPGALGSDRWCGLIGGRAAYPGENLLIATIGTATTLEALRADGMFTGGLIAPGWLLMMQSLGSSTAQLPTLSTDTARGVLASAGELAGELFATDTRAGLSAGCLFAQAGLLERAWRDLRAKWRADVRLVVGGGGAEVVAGALSVPHTGHDSLVIAGLALIAREAVDSNPLL
jgi:type III pantothenate kinase